VATALDLGIAKADADDTLTITISGLAAGELNKGSYDTTTHLYTLTYADLAGLQITAGKESKATLGVTVTNSEGAGASASETITINVTGLFDAGNTVPTSISATEGANTPITGISISDADASGDVTTTLSVLHGTLTLLSNVSGGLSAGQISGNGSSAVTLTGTVAQINATLAASNGLLYLELGDHTSDTLTVATQDQGTSPLLTATSTVPITVTTSDTDSGPEAPVVGGSTGTVVNTNTQVMLGATVAAVDSDDVLGNVTITGLPTNLSQSSFNGGSKAAGRRTTPAISTARRPLPSKAAAPSPSTPMSSVRPLRSKTAPHWSSTAASIARPL
jgi:hypothetical protein